MTFTGMCHIPVWIIRVKIKEEITMQSLFEKNGGTYRQEGGYLIPNLEVPKQNGTIGKYGRLHKKFIKQNHPAYYSALFMSGKLFDYLREVDLKAQNELDRLIPLLAKQLPVWFRDPNSHC